MNEEETTETGEENSESSENSSEDNTEKPTLKVLVSDGNNTYDITDLGTTDTLSLDKEQYSELVKAIDGLKDGSTVLVEEKQLRELIKHIDNVNGTMKKNAEVTSASTVQMPSDWYTTTADIQGQQTFYLSLIFGILVAIAFCMGFIGHE